MRFFNSLAAFSLLACLTASLPASAQTLTFDTLPTAPGVTGSGLFVDANGGSRTVSGVTFNAAAHSDWEIVGSGYVPYPPFSSDPLAVPHSGAYALAGNAFSGTDFFDTVYNGLTLSTDKRLTSLYIGYDNNGGGAHDADVLTLTAFGAGGDLASKTVTLSGPALSFLDTSSLFGGLSGVTGYRFETTATDPVTHAAGQAYVIADDLNFGGAGNSTPVPEQSSSASLAFLLLFGAGSAALAARRKQTRQFRA